MTTANFLENPMYIRSLQLLREHHRLMQHGSGDSAEAELVREEMSDQWAELSEEEQAFLWGLSADLYMLENDEIPEEASTEKLSAAQLRSHVADALLQQDWLGLLQLLRKDPSLLKPDQAAFLRSRAYDGIDHVDIAAEFLRYAVGQDPDNFDYRYQLVEMMIRAKQITSAVQLAEEHLENHNAPPELRMQAGSVLFLSTQDLSTQEAHPVLERAIRELLQALTQARGQPELSYYSSYAWVCVGYCYEALGDMKEAEQAFEASVQIFPGLSEGLSALARLHAPQDLAGAIKALAHSHRPILPTVHPRRAAALAA